MRKRANICACITFKNDGKMKLFKFHLKLSFFKGLTNFFNIDLPAVMEPNAVLKASANDSCRCPKFWWLCMNFLHRGSAETNLVTTPSEALLLCHHSNNVCNVWPVSGNVIQKDLNLKCRTLKKVSSFNEQFSEQQERGILAGKQWNRLGK